MARSELDRWKLEHPQAYAHRSEFAPIRERLQVIKLADIMWACHVSKPADSGWRSGRHVPALRHWPALARLAGLDTCEPVRAGQSALLSNGHKPIEAS
jgi:hypothetical protein